MAVQVLSLPDGRKLDYWFGGVPDGIPMIYIHGTPGAYTPPCGLNEACQKAGIKLLTYTRAGYGDSTRQHGRSIVDHVADVKALKDHVKFDKCLIGGWSGGGPHVLACAARLPGVVAALHIAGVAPYDAEGLNWSEGQGQDNLDETEAALKGEETLTKFMAAQRGGLLAADAKGIVGEMESLLPPADKKAILDNPGLGQSIVDSFQEALKHNSDGAIDDSLAFIKPWGFQLSEVKVPVVLYHGSVDLMCPYAHGKWIASHLPQDKVKVHLLDGEGHVSIFLSKIDEMLAEMIQLWRAQA